MSFPTSQDEFPNVCPYLGLADDADSHATYATEAHRCYRLENPTRITTNHQESFCLGANHPTCPVFKGEGIGAAVGAGTTAANGPERPNRGGRQGQQGRPPTPPPARGEPRGGARPLQGAAPQRPTTERPVKGSLNPRPRAGGISMPVATIGLFLLAGVVIALAFWIQSLVGDDDDGALSTADVFASQQAASRTATTATRTATVGTPGPGTPTATGATRTATPGAGTPTVAAPAGSTYVVEEGDSCQAIADSGGITLDDLLRLNPQIDANCSNLIIGDTLKLK